MDQDHVIGVKVIIITPRSAPNITARLHSRHFSCSYPTMSKDLSRVPMAADSGSTPEVPTCRTIEQRMEDFVAAFGDLPDGACRLQDYEARYHSDIWIQRLLGEGIACDYVIGYQFEGKWWTFCFDRRKTPNSGDQELWVVEAYDSDGRSWRGRFLYRPDLALWRRGPPEHRTRLPSAAAPPCEE